MSVYAGSIPAYAGNIQSLGNTLGRSVENFFGAWDEENLSESDQRIRDQLTQLAKPSPEPLIWYRWGDEYYEKQRIGKKPAFDPAKVNRSHLMAGGKGLYVCEDPVSSARYARNLSRPAIVTVMAPAGSPVLDLTSEEVQQELKQLGLRTPDVFRTNPPVFVKVHLNYWVLKTSDGIEVLDFDGNEISTENLSVWSRYLRYDLPKVYFDGKIQPVLQGRFSTVNPDKNEEVRVEEINRQYLSGGIQPHVEEVSVPRMDELMCPYWILN